MLKKINPEFDQHGYPTDETLTTIESWHCNNYEDILGCFEYIINTWNKKYGTINILICKRWNDDIKHTSEYIYDFVTGGWSGNEDIIGSMTKNVFIWNTWQYTERGGKYNFRLKIEK